MKYINKFMALFLILDLIFGICLVYIRRNTAQYFIQLHNIEQDIIQLNEDYNNLQFEKLRLTNTDRIKKYANKHGFHLPENDEIRIFQGVKKNVNSK